MGSGIAVVRLHSGFALQARTRLVECNVAVWANASEEQFDATRATDLLFVGNAFFLEIVGIAIQDVDVGGVDVYVTEEVLVHEAVIRLRMLSRYPHVLVHVERDDIAKGDVAVLVCADEVLVNALWR